MDTVVTPEADLMMSRRQISRLSSEINKKLNQGTAYESVLDFVFESLESAIPFDRIGIALLEDEGQKVSLRWMRSTLGGSNLTFGYSAPLKGSSLERLLVSGKPRIINDLCRYFEDHPDSRSTRAALDDGIRSSLTFPLKAEGQSVGFVFFSSGKLNTYQDVHLDLFSEVSEDLSLLVQYGRLRQFFETKKSHDQFLRTALHDLRSPLGVMQGFIEVIKSEPWFNGLDPSSQQIFGILSRNTQFMFDLIADLAELNRLSGHRESIDFQDVVLSDFLAELDRYGRVLVAKKNICFELIMSSALPRIWRIDPTRIRQVLDNLLTNAIKFSMPGSKIEISVNDRSQKLVFSVKDSGQGIPFEEIPKLFLDFSKTSVRPTAGESSTGLGLAIARRIVEGHGGEISAESIVGVGSTFTFWLPNNAETQPIRPGVQKIPDSFDPAFNH